MSVVKIPQTAAETEALKQEIRQFLNTHGADAKARTVTLKHFMKERSLPPLFIRRAMGRIGLDKKGQSQDKAKVIAEEKDKLQRRVQKMLGSFDVLNEEAISQLYSSLRKEGHKRRFIRTALYKIAAKLRQKYGPEASKQLVDLINTKKKNSPEKVRRNGAMMSNTQNKNAGKKVSPQEAKGRTKNVSFSGLSGEESDKSGKRIPPTPIYDRSLKKLKSHSSGKKVKSPSNSSDTPVGNSVTELPETPKSNESSPHSNKLMKTSSSSKTVVTPLPGSGSAIGVNKNHENLNGSFIQSKEKRKCNSNEVSNGDAQMVGLLESEGVKDSPSQDEQSNDSPVAKFSILKAGRVSSSSNISSSTKKTAGKRVSFGSIKSPEVKTPVTSRQSINLIDLATPQDTKGILEEECPKLVSINDASTTKKGKKSPKFSPRLTRSAAKKKVSTMA